MKKLFLLSFSLIFILNGIIYAHEAPAGSESLGWENLNVDSPSHWTIDNLDYTYSFVSAALQTVTDRAAGDWDDAISDLSMSAVSSMYNNGTIYQYTDSSTSVAAHAGYSATNNHATSWNLHYNDYYMPFTNADYNTRVAVHEMGHSIGLGHLYFRCNTTLGCNNSSSIDNSDNALYEGDSVSGWDDAVDYWGDNYPGPGDITGAKTVNGWN